MYSKPHREVYLCSELVDAVYRTNDRSWETLTVNLEEISGNSLTLSADTLIPPGAAIELTCKSSNLKGIVSSAEFDDVLGWFIQMELDADPKVGSSFVPQHLMAVPAEFEFGWPALMVA